MQHGVMQSTLKTKVYEFAFSDSTWMCPPPTKCVPKSVKSTKSEPSMWERADKMNTMVGSLKILSVTHKVGHNNKKKININNFEVVNKKK